MILVPLDDITILFKSDTAQGISMPSPLFLLPFLYFSVHFFIPTAPRYLNVFLVLLLLFYTRHP